MPLAAGQQAVGKLFWLQLTVARDVLEPFRGVACRRLQFQHFHASLRLVGCQRVRDVTIGSIDALRQADGILQCELGTGTNREMCGMRSISHQHDAVLYPFRIGNSIEVDELRAPQVAHIGQQCMPVEPRCEQEFAEGNRLRYFHSVQAGSTPGCLACLDDEGGGVGVEAIGVRLEPPPLGFDEDEGEGIEQLVGAEPGEAVGARLDGRQEVIGVACADGAVDAIRRDDQVGVGEFGDILDLALEDQFNAQTGRALLQDVEQALAFDAAEAMAAGSDDPALEMDIDVVPMDEIVADVAVRSPGRRP